MKITCQITHTRHVMDPNSPDLWSARGQCQVSGCGSETEINHPSSIFDSRLTDKNPIAPLKILGYTPKTHKINSRQKSTTEPGTKTPRNAYVFAYAERSPESGMDHSAVKSQKICEILNFTGNGWVSECLGGTVAGVPIGGGVGLEIIGHVDTDMYVCM